MYVIIKSLIKERDNSMAMLTGEYSHQLDAKNRMRIPAKLKKELGDEYYFCIGTNHCITVLSKAEAESQLEKLLSIRYSDLGKQKVLREIAKSFVQAVEDSQGRVVLPPELRRHAQLGKDDKELMICGAINRIEIWSKKVYDEYFSDSDEEDFDTRLSKLEDF
ncbi:MAG: division/cell wall cluster transcriptional repressor MraZ [Candidatus Coproplasma sp.]